MTKPENLGHTPLKITPTQRRNLAKLADKLDTVAAYAFDMDLFHTASDFAARAKYPCGSVACAVGWGPAAGVKAKPRESWGDYAQRVFGVEDGWEYGFGDLWHWCFTHYWRSIDNTPQGAAARIRYALEHGVPSNAVEQRTRLTPLIYTVARSEA